MNEKQVDLLIVGGGLTGAALMLALARSGFSTLLVEANVFDDKISPDFDARTLALSPASVRILQQLSVWPLLRDEATPIETIHVSRQSGFGSARLRPDSKAYLGYVVQMHHINLALHQLLDHRQILAPARLTALDLDNNLATVQGQQGQQMVRARMIVAADGANSCVRHFAGLKAEVKDYHQHALIANIGLNRSHGNCAYERFTASGPLALLPMTDNRAALVWSLPPEEAQRLSIMPEQAFLRELQQVFGYKAGRFSKAGKRAIFPLQQSIMPRQAVWPLVFAGNAAHTLHPVAGQGFNLGLRDVATLAQCIVAQGLNAGMLKSYLAMRHYDQSAIISFTDTLVELFTNRFPGIGLARQLGLIAVDNISILKKILTDHAGGFSGVVPDLACGMDLGNSNETAV